jgi:uncharacterized protein (DUF1810 family)
VSTGPGAGRGAKTGADHDPFLLSRFVAAQDAGRTYQRALAELRSGRKTSHWMWFIFPQVAGLGFSDLAQRYAISGLAEATAYLAHPVLGPRLLACTRAVAGAAEGSTADAILGPVDAMKLRSCLTLFAAAAPGEAVFAQALARFFDGQPDQATLALLPPG